MGKERRNLAARGALVQGIINTLVENPSVTLTVGILQVWLNVPADAAERILSRLVSSGLMKEIGRGVWAPRITIMA